MCGWLQRADTIAPISAVTSVATRLCFGWGRNSISPVSETEQQEFDDLLRALANRHRRLIVQECWSAARSAGEIADLLDLAPASASEHLKVLRKHGLVDLNINGTFRIYQTRRQAVLRLRGLFEAVFPMEEP